MWNAADEVALLCEGANFKLDPWQVHDLGLILGERPDGKWAAKDAAFLVARQNGKGGILHALDLAGLFLFDDVREILHSAHEHKTAKKAYREIKDIIEGAPHLYAQVERRGTRVVGFRQSNEDTSITIGSGRTKKVLRFIARSRTSGRGFSPQMVIMDEAQECTYAARDALKHTLRAAKNPLMVWCGTVPGPDDNGQVFKWLRDRGRKGGDPSLVWIEHTPPADCDLESDEAIVWANPAMGYRLTWESIDLERAEAMTNDEVWEGWCREALSWWPDGDDAEAKWLIWSKPTWWACGSGETEKQAAEKGWITEPTYAVDMPADRSKIAVGAAGKCREGGIGIEIVAYDVAGPWLVKYLTDNGIKSVAIDKNGPAGALVSELEEAGIEVVEATYADLKRATGDTFDAVNDGDIVHRHHPELDNSVAHGSKRKSGDVFLIDRYGPGWLVNAVILARWGHMKPKEADAGYFGATR